MLNNDIYAIYTEDDERRGSIKELYPSFDEAKNNRFKYSNWFTQDGDVWIKLYKANGKFRCTHSWHILPDGTIDCEYSF